MSVRLPDGGFVPVTHVGIVHFECGLILNHVLVIPSFKFNLMSISRLVEHGLYTSIFSSTSCVFQDIKNSRKIGTADLCNGLYWFRQSERHDLDEVSVSSYTTKFFSTFIHSVHLINRLPTHVLDGNTPYTILMKTEVSYQHLRVFGCLAYVSFLVQKRTKFDHRANPCVFLGFPANTKGYVLYNLVSNQIVISRNVVLHELIFPFTCPQNFVIASGDFSDVIKFFDESQNSNIQQHAVFEENPMDSANIETGDDLDSTGPQLKSPCNDNINDRICSKGPQPNIISETSIRASDDNAGKQISSRTRRPPAHL
ncbi:Retrovirus-related Pol polyprotein from transposon TNT 1-94 [Linum perenne]